MDYENRYKFIKQRYEAKKSECDLLKTENRELKRKLELQSQSAKRIETYEHDLKMLIDSANAIKSQYSQQLIELQTLKAEYVHRMDSLLKPNIVKRS